MDTQDEQTDQLAALVEAALPDPNPPALTRHPTMLTSSSPKNTAGSQSSPPRSAATATSACATASRGSERLSPPAATRAGMSWNRSCGPPAATSPRAVAGPTGTPCCTRPP